MPILLEKNFQKISFSFRMFEDFEADNEFDNSKVGDGTTNFYTQNLICTGYYMKSDLYDVL